MEWKNWFGNGSSHGIPNLDDDFDEIEEPEQQPQEELETVPAPSVTEAAEEQPIPPAEQQEERELAPMWMPKKAPVPRRGEEIPRGEDEEYEEEIDEEDLLPPPEAKKLKGRIKKIVNAFRIRSLGLDGLGAVGLAICAAAGIFLHHLTIGFILGTLILIAAAVFEMISWMDAAHQVKEELFTPELRHRYRKSVFRTGVICFRILGILFAWQLALLYMDKGLQTGFTWQRWVGYGVLFSILVCLVLFYLRPLVVGTAQLRGIEVLSEEARETRKRKRKTVILWRVIGILLILGIGAGQIWFNQRDWKSFTEGKTFDAVDSFKKYVEKEVILEAEEPSADHRLSPKKEAKETFQILDGDGNVVVTVNRRNQTVTDVGVIYDENGRDPKTFVAYSSDDEEVGRWKMEVTNLFFFLAYPLTALMCGACARSAWKKKMSLQDTLYEEELDEEV